MASAASSTPGRSVLLLVSLATLLLVFVSAVECYDGRHAVAHSAVARRSRLGTRHVHHRRTTVPHRYILAEKSSPTGGGPKNHSSSPATANNASAPAPAPPAGSQTDGRHHRRSHKHQVRNWIIGFVVGSLAGVISGLVLSVLFRMALNCIRGRYRSRSGVMIFTPKLIRRPEHLAFIEKEDGLAPGRHRAAGAGRLIEEQDLGVPDEREGRWRCAASALPIAASRTARPASASRFIY